MIKKHECSTLVDDNRKSSLHSSEGSPYESIKGIDKCYYYPLWFGKENGPYTIIAEFGAGASYPEYRVIEGAVDLFVLEGELIFNGESFGVASYIRVEKDDHGKVSSISGCRFLVVASGSVEHL